MTQNIEMKTPNNGTKTEMVSRIQITQYMRRADTENSYRPNMIKNGYVDHIPNDEIGSFHTDDTLS